MTPHVQPLWARALRNRAREAREVSDRTTALRALTRPPCVLCGRAQPLGRAFFPSSDGLRCRICAETRLAELALD